MVPACGPAAPAAGAGPGAPQALDAPTGGSDADPLRGVV